MSQIESITQTTTSFGRGRGALGKAGVGSAAVGAVMVIALLIGMRGPTAVPAAHAASGQVTDGWMVNFSAANAARRQLQAEQATDGWASRFLVGTDKPAAALTDGWMSRISAENAARRLTLTGHITDGWATGHSASADKPSKLVDGWSVRYLK